MPGQDRPTPKQGNKDAAAPKAFKPKVAKKPRKEVKDD